MTTLDRVSSVDDLQSFEPSGSWEGRETALEAGLEGWVEAIAKADARAGGVAALACAEHALPIVAASYAASGMDFGGPDDEWGDSATPRQQLEHVRAWVEHGTPIPELAADYTRQLNVWDEDLRPTQGNLEGWYVYFVETTNLLVMAILHDESGGPYGTWSGSVSAARSAVCSYKAMHRAGSDRGDDAAALIAAIKSAF